MFKVKKYSKVDAILQARKVHFEIPFVTVYYTDY